MKYFKLKLNSFKNNLILAGSIFCIALGIFVYVNYLINKPLDMEIPKHFIYNNTNIALAWTDDNTGENLIIQSDKKKYSGFSGVDVYFSITNTSRKDQDANIVIWLPSNKTKAEKVERINKDGSNFQFSIFNFEINSNFKVKNRKDVGKSSTGNAINDKIKSGETNYYKATIKYPSMSKGEFFIEAFGDNGAYGHLDPWYSSNWNYKRKITINASQIATTTSAFPVLATTTIADLKTVANGGKVGNDNGYDIIFVDDDDSTLLNFEREKYASTTGEIVYWIKTDISSTTDKTIYMYYGNASAIDQATTTGVWDDNFVMVQHMQETPAGTIYDSTQYSNDGTTNNMDSADQVAGQTDGSLDFDGDDIITIPDNSVFDNLSAFAISVWIYYRGGDIWGMLLDRHNGKYQLYRYNNTDNIGGYMDSIMTDTDTGVAFTLNTWQQIQMVYDGSECRWYKNGNLIYTKTGLSGTTGNGTVLNIGGFSSTNWNIDGIIDEVRVSNIVRSAGWIETEYNNQSAVGSFMTIGEEEDKIPTITSVEDSPDFLRHGSTVTFYVDWNDSDSSNIKVKICKTDSLTNQNCDGGYYASSTVFTANDPETVTYTIEDDDLGTKHYYAFVCDSDGNCSDSAHDSFTIRTTQINSSSANNENWYNANWKYKRAITLDSSRIATTTSDFPVLATTTLADLKSYAHDGNVGNSNGYDIIFVDSDNKTLLNFEREKYASTTGEIVYWIKTDISSTTDKTIYMYYGNASATDQATTTRVWDDNFVMVQHMQEDPSGFAPQIIDSTSNSNDGTASGTMTTSDQVAGQIDGSLDFDGTDNYIDCGNDSSLNNMDTISVAFWMHPNVAGGQKKLIDKEEWWIMADSYTHSSLAFYIDGHLGDPRAEYYDTVIIDEWQYIVFIWDGTMASSGFQLYWNGVEKGEPDEFNSGGTRKDDSLYNLLIGGKSTSDYFDGIIDEVRISNTARSAGWIKTEYNNQSAVGNFMTIGEKESLNRTAIINAPIKNYLTDGLVGHWTFNGEDMDWGSSTAEALDRSGNNNNGNVINGAKAIIGKAGQGLEFDGVDDYVLDDDAENYLNGLTSVTVSLWIKSNVIGTDKGFIVGTNPMNADVVFGIRYDSSGLRSGGTNVIKAIFGGDTDETVSGYESASYTQTTDWSHIVATWNGGEALKLYINGVLDIPTWSSNDGSSISGATKLIIGKGHKDAVSSWDGIIDEVRIYNRALSEDEIKQLYRIGERSMKF